MADDILTDFQIVWEMFPRKTAKAVARKAWHKLNPDAETVQKMIDALKWQKATDQWQRGIIPHCSTWINQARWEDENPATVTRRLFTPEDVAHAQAIRRQKIEEFEQEIADAHRLPPERPVWTMSDDAHQDLMQRMAETKAKLFREPK